MKKYRLISGVLALSMLLAACGSTETGSNSVNVNKDCVYREGDVNYAQENGDITQFITVGDTIYTEQYVYPDYGSIYARTGAAVAVDAAAGVIATEEIVVTETVAAVAEEEPVEEETVPEGEQEEYTITRMITSYQLDGTKKNQITIQLPENSGSGSFTADTQGNIYSTNYEYATYVGDDMVDKIYLSAHSAAGEEMWKVHLNKDADEEEGYYIISLYCINDNQLILESYAGIEVYDLQGNRTKVIPRPEDMECRLFKIRDNQFAYMLSNGETCEIQTVDIEKETFGEKVKVPFNYYRYTVFSGSAYDLYMSDEYGIHGYNIGDTEITKIMDYIASDFAGNHMYQVAVIDEENMFGYYYAEDGAVLHKFTKVPPEEIVDKINLTLGCYYLDGSVKRKVIDFNKNSDTHKIHIMDYSVYDTMDDYTQGMTRLNTDIVSGNVPDIILLNTDMPINSYIAKGLFADLNTFIENDPDFKKEDFLPNILEAFSTNGELYQLVPSFSIMTFAGKTSDVGAERGWTMDEALQLLASKPEGTQLMSEITRNGFLNYCLWICNEQYVDWEKGECYFDSEGFIKALEYANTLPAEIDYTDLYDDESFWQQMETQYRDGRTLISLAYLSDFRDYSYMKYVNFGEDITYIGFPVESGQGASINAGIRFAISAQSSNQEVAWDFVKSFFTEEYQEEISYDFPVRISSLEKREQKAWEKPYYLDENGEKVEYDDYYYIGGVEIKAEPLTAEETAVVMDLVKSVDKITNYEDDLYNIVVEEAESYFAGQKSAQEAASIIQSRAKIYVNENR